LDDYSALLEAERIVLALKNFVKTTRDLS